VGVKGTFHGHCVNPSYSKERNVNHSQFGNPFLRGNYIYLSLMIDKEISPESSMRTAVLKGETRGKPNDNQRARLGGIDRSIEGS